jgi:hypothetical protein
MPRDSPQLRQRIVKVVADIGREMLRRVLLQEHDCRVTKGGYIEHL